MDATNQELTFVIPRRFCGPPDSGNGGWVSGSIAQFVDPHGPVTVRLATPPPLERPLRIEHLDDGVVVQDGSLVIARAQSTARLPEPDRQALVSYEEAVTAGQRYLGLHDHPFPTCFSCGVRRDPSDALCLRTGRVTEDGLFATAWTPTEVTAPITWAAMDCPGAWAGDVAGRPMVLGTMTAQVDALPVAGEPHVILSWTSGEEGRKVFSHCALLGPDGRLMSQSQATWILVDPAAVRPRER